MAPLVWVSSPEKREGLTIVGGEGIITATQEEVVRGALQKLKN